MLESRKDNEKITYQLLALKELLKEKIDSFDSLDLDKIFENLD
jgi:hypothetical protein